MVRPIFAHQTLWKVQGLQLEPSFTDIPWMNPHPLFNLQKDSRKTQPGANHSAKEKNSPLVSLLPGSYWAGLCRRKCILFVWFLLVAVLIIPHQRSCYILFLSILFALYTPKRNFPCLGEKEQKQYISCKLFVFFLMCVWNLSRKKTHFLTNTEDPDSSSAWLLLSWLLSSPYPLQSSALQVAKANHIFYSFIFLLLPKDPFCPCKVNTTFPISHHVRAVGILLYLPHVLDALDPLIPWSLGLI